MKPPLKRCTAGGPSAASWQMLRHASGSGPAGGGCRDVHPKRARLLQYDIRCTPFLHPTPPSERCWVPVSLLLRKSIPINLQPTLFFPMHQNVDGGERQAADWRHTPTKAQFRVKEHTYFSVLRYLADRFKAASLEARRRGAILPPPTFLPLSALPTCATLAALFRVIRSLRGGRCRFPLASSPPGRPAEAPPQDPTVAAQPGRNESHHFHPDLHFLTRRRLIEAKVPAD